MFINAIVQDPREAEERRYLIRQNKKLLNQLFESAKKIERLEVTKVEMKEQLELLDFQIVEVENQKAMMEEELRKIPPTVHEETQTEVRFYCINTISLQYYMHIKIRDGQ
ncbi:unnamed protein product [Trichobilharzia regenti]|nr:unnamed protein product [Trichobilharzia regenti]